MTTRTRRLIFVWGSLLLLLLLISALPQLDIAPRRLVRLESSSQDPLLDIAQTIQLMVLAAMPLFVIFLLLFLPVLRSWRTLVAAGLILLVLITVGWLLSRMPIQEAPVPMPSALPTGEPGAETAAEPLPTDIPMVEPAPLPEPPSWMPLLLSFIAVSVIITVVAIVLWWYWPREPEPSPLIELSREAEQALAALEAGETLQNVVVRCYVEMGRVLSETRGVQRAQAMTPREFEQQLAQLGLPQEPVTGLTRLFERIRYGTDETDPAAEKEATDSLALIVRACREGI